jgi:putative oxidoreductase
MAMQDTSPAAFSATDRLAASSAGLLLLVGRILLGWLFLAAGYGKFMNIAGSTGYLTSLGMPAPNFWAWVSAFAEVILGVLLILGIATRYAALGVFIYVLIATAIAHRYWQYPAAQQLNQYNHFLKNLAIMGGSLALFVTGAGGWSVDGRMKK